jgi:hypothetical protein
MAVRAVSLLLFLLALPAGSLAADGPQPPCGSPPLPAFAPPGQPPAVRSWSESELAAAGWQPATCLGWTQGRSRMVAALAAEFTERGPIDSVLARLGAFSAYKTISYWSASRHSWQKLVDAAGLVEGGRDLAPAALVPGRTHHYFEEDRAGRTTYRLSVLEHSERRAVIEIENSSAISLSLLPLFPPGALQSTMFLERSGADRWAWYHAVHAGEGASLLAANGAASTINRMTALYLYMAGQPSGARIRP